MSRASAALVTPDREAAAAGHPEKADLKLWLRLLTCTSLVEAEIRTRLREHFGTTLPRFDLLAQLERAPDGLTPGELSRRMMVSNGNVTAVLERLAAAGLVERRAHDTDRRVQVVTLTTLGRQAFAAMAAEHEAWLAELFGGLSAREVEELMRLLGKAKGSVGAKLSPHPALRATLSRRRERGTRPPFSRLREKVSAQRTDEGKP